MGELVQLEPAARVTIHCSPGQLRGAASWHLTDELARAGVAFRDDLRVGFEWPLGDGAGLSLSSWLDPVARDADVLGADLVVSDNLAGILSVRPDAVLSGSFLWSEVLGECDDARAAELVAHELSLLRRIRPPMVCVDELATPGVLRETRAIQVPWICDRPARTPSPRRPGGPLRVAVTAGTTDAAAFEARQVCDALSDHAELWCDAPLARDPRVRASVTGVLPPDGDFSGVDVVACRPGAGTVTDCVAQGVPFLLFLDAHHAEMRSNAERLVAARLADVLPDPTDAAAVRAAVLRFADPAVHAERAIRLTAGPRNGARRAAEELATLMHERAIPA